MIPHRHRMRVENLSNEVKLNPADLSTCVMQITQFQLHR
jgi:hypothetical protein